MHYAAYSQAERALAVQRRQRYAGVVVGQAEGQDDATQQQEAVLRADAGRARYGLTAEQWLLTWPDGQVTPHVALASGENEWYTPPEYIEAARSVLAGGALPRGSCA